VTITVVGSIAYDAVETPFGIRERMLGGAATHFALAASLLNDVRIVGPVGDDFGDAELSVLQTRGSNIDDVERVAGGKTFFWKGKYGWDLNTRETLDTQLNVFEHFAPKLSQASRDCDALFLANIQPGLQLQVREQCAAARFVALDSMNLWIDTSCCRSSAGWTASCSTTRSCVSSPESPTSSPPPTRSSGGDPPWWWPSRGSTGRP
jgi:hypothetical protein